MSDYYCQESLAISRLMASTGANILGTEMSRQVNNFEANIYNTLETFGNTYIIVSGSRGDGVGVYYGYGREESSDYDLVFVDKTLSVTESDTCSKKGVILFKILDIDFVGHVKLKLLNLRHPIKEICTDVNGEMFLSNIKWKRHLESHDLKHVKTKLTVHGPAFNIDMDPKTIQSSLSAASGVSDVRYNDPDFSKTSESGMDSTDYVFCLEGAVWPAEADEWKTRNRVSGWPPQELIDKVIGTGCLYTPVGHKDSPDIDLQWSVSFNKADSILVRSLNETQVQCYILLKMFNTALLKPVSRTTPESTITTSYMMKVLVLWQCEAVHESEWRPENLLCLLLKCLKTLRDGMSKRFLPHYYVVKRNMFVLSELNMKNITENTIEVLDRIICHPIEEVKKLELLTKAFDEPDKQMEHKRVICLVNSWFRARHAMAEIFYFIGNQALHLPHAYTDVSKSIERTKTVLETLEQIGGYMAPMRDLVKNSLGVLLYAQALSEGTSPCDSHKQRREAMQLFAGSKKFNADLTHSPLRIATCLICDKRYPDAIRQIQRAEEALKLKETLMSIDPKRGFQEHADMNRKYAMQFLQTDGAQYLQQVYRIAERDIKNPDFLATALALKSVDPLLATLFAGTWSRSVFDVIFTSAEGNVLPKPVLYESYTKDVNLGTELMPQLPGAGRIVWRTYILTLDAKFYVSYLTFLCAFEIWKDTVPNHLMVIAESIELDEPVARERMAREKLVETSLGVEKAFDNLAKVVESSSGESLMTGLNILACCSVANAKYHDAARFLMKSMELFPNEGKRINAAYDYAQQATTIIASSPQERQERELKLFDQLLSKVHVPEFSTSNLTTSPDSIAYAEQNRANLSYEMFQDRVFEPLEEFIDTNFIFEENPRNQERVLYSRVPPKEPN